jgi:hypothetical protein
MVRYRPVVHGHASRGVALLPGRCSFVGTLAQARGGVEPGLNDMESKSGERSPVWHACPMVSPCTGWHGVVSPLPEGGPSLITLLVVVRAWRVRLREELHIPPQSGHASLSGTRQPQWADGWRAMQSTPGTGMDVPSEQADLRGVPLPDMAAAAPMAVDIVLGRVLSVPAGVAVPAHGMSFSSCI